jgi:hypothetical protein
VIYAYFCFNKFKKIFVVMISNYLAFRFEIFFKAIVLMIIDNENSIYIENNLSKHIENHFFQTGLKTFFKHNWKKSVPNSFEKNFSLGIEINFFQTILKRFSILIEKVSFFNKH